MGRKQHTVHFPLPAPAPYLPRTGFQPLGEPLPLDTPALAAHSAVPSRLERPAGGPDSPLTTRRQKAPWKQSSAAPSSSDTTRLIAARRQVWRGAKVASARLAAGAPTPQPPCLPAGGPTPAARARLPGPLRASPPAGPGAGRAAAAREYAGLERTTLRVRVSREAPRS